MPDRPPCDICIEKGKRAPNPAVCETRLRGERTRLNFCHDHRTLGERAEATFFDADGAAFPTEGVLTLNVPATPSDVADVECPACHNQWQVEADANYEVTCACGQRLRLTSPR